MEPLDLFSRREILSVGELVAQLKRTTEDRFDFVWVEGEISGMRRPGSGHVYFALKDDSAMLRAVLFRHKAALLRFAPEDGLQVLCQGRVSVYQARGEVQLVVDTMEPRGAGALALAFEQVKKRLSEEGLFDQERKKPLPVPALKVAVVTSAQGAALRDFLHVLHKRYAGIRVAVYPTLVQGDEAAGQMVKALEDLAAWGWPQVIVLTRGGGSPEDLWAFNDELLARAIADCPIPVVSAVGHEVDVSISDLVADMRAPTPSAAAELLARPPAEMAERLERLDSRLARAGVRMLEKRRTILAGLRRGLGDPGRRLIDQRLRVDDLLIRGTQALRGVLHARSARLSRAREGLKAARPDRRLAQMGGQLEALKLRLNSAVRSGLAGRRSSLEAAKAKLAALGPARVLGRGYAVVVDQSGRVITDAARVKEGQRVGINLSRGGLIASVEEVEP